MSAMFPLAHVSFARTHTRTYILLFFVGFTFVFVLCQAYVSSVYESPCLPLSFRWPLGLPCRPRPLSLCLASSLVFHSFYISCLVFFLLLLHTCIIYAIIDFVYAFQRRQLYCTPTTRPNHSQKTQPTWNFATRKLNHSSAKFTANFSRLINFRFELGNLSCLNGKDDGSRKRRKESWKNMKKNCLHLGFSFPALAPRGVYTMRT